MRRAPCPGRGGPSSVRRCCATATSSPTRECAASGGYLRSVGFSGDLALRVVSSYDGDNPGETENWAFIRLADQMCRGECRLPSSRHYFIPIGSPGGDSACGVFSGLECQPATVDRIGGTVMVKVSWTQGNQNGLDHWDIGLGEQSRVRDRGATVSAGRHQRQLAPGSAGEGHAQLLGDVGRAVQPADGVPGAAVPRRRPPRRVQLHRDGVVRPARGRRRAGDRRGSLPRRQLSHSHLRRPERRTTSPGGSRAGQTRNGGRTAGSTCRSSRCA